MQRAVGRSMAFLVAASSLGSSVAAPVAAAPNRPTLIAAHVDHGPKVDGRLDDPEWKLAAVGSAFEQRLPNTGEPARNQTEIRVLYSDRALYFGVQNLVADVNAIVAKEMQRDAELFRDDMISILIDTFHDHRNAYEFSTNPNGARLDQLITDEGADVNRQWDGVWDVHCQRSEQGWSAEFEIPFSTLRFQPGVDAWGFQVRRFDQATHEESYWAPIGRTQNRFSVSFAGTLAGVNPPPPGMNLRIKPFAVGTVRRDPTHDTDGDAGLDLKWGVGRNMTLDLTARTDFAETEIDDQRVNLTRFPLFFPEKREFFLENAGAFQFGLPPNGPPLFEPFFSRRIGLAAGNVVPIDAGVRLTGRTDGWTLGLLDVRTAGLAAPNGTISETNWAVARVKRNLGVRSYAGLMLTDKNARDGDDNRFFGIDGGFLPDEHWRAYGYLARSWDDALGDGRDSAAGATLRRSGEDVDWDVDWQRVGDNFSPGSGFLLRSGFQRYHGHFFAAPVRNPGQQFRNWVAEGVFDRYDDLEGGQESGYSSLTLGAAMNSGANYQVYGERSFERLDAPFEIRPGIVTPVGEYNFSDLGFYINTDYSKPIALDFSYSDGSFFDGTNRQFDSTVAWRPAARFSARLNWSRTEIDLPAGSFVSETQRLRLGFNFKPTLFANALLQYNHLDDLLSLNLRLRWEYSPGSDIFFVFNQGWDAASLGQRTTTDRAITIKFTRMFQL